MTWKKRLGLLKSQAIYYWKPGNQIPMYRFYSQFIHEGDLCFDLGAHIGNRTAIWRRIGARVIALEPQPHCVRFLNNKFGADKQVIIQPWAVGASSGTANLFINSINPSISTLRSSDWQSMMSNLSTVPLKWDEVSVVEVHTLEDLISQYGIPKFCKIDVEGFEVKVLEGLNTCLPHFSFEFISPDLDSVVSAIRLIKNLGKYSFNYSLREQHRFELPDYCDAGLLMKSLKALGQRIISGDIYAKCLYP